MIAQPTELTTVQPSCSCEFCISPQCRYTFSGGNLGSANKKGVSHQGSPNYPLEEDTMLTLHTVLRLVHIFAGVFWAGANLMMAGFINPSIKATAPDSSKFMQYLAQKSGYPRSAEIAGWLTVLAGLTLYWWVSGGFQPAWIISRYGMALTIGGLLAIAGLVVGYTVQKPAAKRIGALGQEIQSYPSISA